jgi:NADPH:quinone reductase-like Zn-dependent oxidoreductase
MKAVVYNNYGPPEVLKIREVAKPVPKENEVLVRVMAVSVNFGDLLARNFKNTSPGKFNMPLLFWILARLSFGLNKPAIKILGNTFSGEVESFGEKVTRFRKGEAVFGYTGEKMGTYAEYICIPGTGIIATKPSNVSHEEASAIPYGSIMALNLLKKARVQPGQRVLVIGASGGIGWAAVQLLKNYYGAIVTGVCSGPNVESVKTLGAETVIDYTKEDLTKITGKFDLIFDILGKRSYSSCKHLLNNGGICLYASFKIRKLLQALWTSIKGGRRVVCALAIPVAADLEFIKSLTEQGRIKPVIDKCFPFEQTAEAHSYMESGNRRGGVVITNNFKEDQG